MTVVKQSKNYNQYKQNKQNKQYTRYILVFLVLIIIAIIILLAFKYINKYEYFTDVECTKKDTKKDTNENISKLTKQECELVIARYNEDIAWSLPYSHLRTVYNKGKDDLGDEYNPIIKLPNVGTEINTILEHIVRNYDNLANNTIFLQGNISDRSCKDTIPLENFFHNRDNDFVCCMSKMNENSEWKHPPEYNGRKLAPSPHKNIGEFFKQVLEINFINNCDTFYQSNFAVGRKRIHKHPKSYYENILNNTTISKHTFPEEGHFMERAWYQMFSK